MKTSLVHSHNCTHPVSDLKLIAEVFSWDLSRENPVKVPYHLEAFVEGQSLQKFWTTQATNDETMRTKILDNLANLMSQLHVLMFDTIGTLIFEDQGPTPKVKKWIRLETDIDKIMDDGEVLGELVCSGSFNTTKDWLSSMLGEPEEVPKEAEYTKAYHWLLEAAIQSIPAFIDRPSDFALGHPDFNCQNVLVNDDGDITGIIDWDGVRTSPRPLAFARYPSWNTRNWDPVKYGYGEENGEEEDSPAQLLSYRNAYAAAFENARLPDETYSIGDTKLSQILEAIEIAVDYTICRPWILIKLLNFAYDVKSPFTLNELTEAWFEGQAGGWEAEIKERFGQMWHQEETSTSK